MPANKSTGSGEMTKPQTIGLAMIARNGGEDLRLCLESAREAVDQIVVVDTGSTDNTREIAAEFGAIVECIEWPDHFGQARNRALDRVNTDWVLVMDADETLEPGSEAKLRESTNCPENVGGYMVPIRNLFKDPHVSLYGSMGHKIDRRDEREREARSCAEHYLCRFFRKHDGIRYTGRVHELTEPSIRALGMEIALAPFRITHYGQLASPQARESKNEFYRRLGQLKVAEEPNNFLAWYELGSLEHARFANAKEALRCLYRAVEIAPKCTPAWVRIFQIHAQRKEHAQALAAIRNFGPSVQNDLAVMMQIGDLFAEIGNLDQAEIAYTGALRQCREHDDSFWAISNRLGFVEARKGQYMSGLDRLEQSAAQCPHYLQHHHNLMLALVMSGNTMRAAEVAERTLNYFQSAKLFLRAAALHAKNGNTAREQGVLEQGLRTFPNATELAAAFDAHRSACAVAGASNQGSSA